MSANLWTNEVIISGFADEVCTSKDLDLQFAVVAALGMEYLSIRFVSVDGQIKNAVNLTDDELVRVKSKLVENGLNVSSLGSPLGKVKLRDIEDGTSNRFVEFETYLDCDVRRSCEVACQLRTKLLRGFSFYQPAGTAASAHLDQAIDQIGRMVEVAKTYGLIFGLEVEANLVGHTGLLLAEIHRKINDEHLVLIFDGANLVTQGFSEIEVYDQYLSMKPGLGWIHIKDFQRDDSIRSGEYVDEDSLKRFVTVEEGDSDYWRIFQDLRRDGAVVFERSQRLGLPGVFMDLEPHLKGGGQFGGYSDADGFGLAFRSLCRLLDRSNLPYRLRNLQTVKQTM